MISMETLMPISLVTSVAGFAFWASSVATTVTNHSNDLEYIRNKSQKTEDLLDEKLERNQRDLADIKASVAAIDAKISIIIKNR